MRIRKWQRISVLCLIYLLVLSGCSSRTPVTMDLEAVHLNSGAHNVVLTMEEYQATEIEEYTYPSLGRWIDINLTASISKSEDGHILVFTKNESNEYQWRDVLYQYPFYDEEVMGKQDEGENMPLLISPVQVSSDATAVAYQAMYPQGQLIEVSQLGKETMVLDGNGTVWGKQDDIQLTEEQVWNQLEYSWSSDGQTLLFYRVGNLIAELDEEEVAETETNRSRVEETETNRSREAEAGVLLLPYGIYGFDRESGQVKTLWESMKINLPSTVTRYSSSASVVADVNEDQAVLFILFGEDAGSSDVQLWSHDGKVETCVISLPDNPCIQLNLEQGVYYYQESGSIWKAPLGKWGEAAQLTMTDPGLQDFLVAEDEKRIFTIEKKENTTDICLYICDEKQNWYRQVIYVNARDAVNLQLSEDQQELLIECRGEIQNRALIIHFYSKEE